MDGGRDRPGYLWNPGNAPGLPVHSRNNRDNDDSDAAGITVGAVSGPTTEAGGTATFTIELDSEPTGDVLPLKGNGIQLNFHKINSIKFDSIKF